MGLSDTLETRFDSTTASPLSIFKRRSDVERNAILEAAQPLWPGEHGALTSDAPRPSGSSRSSSEPLHD